jgi:hypothetical protein
VLPTARCAARCAESAESCQTSAVAADAARLFFVVFVFAWFAAAALDGDVGGLFDDDAVLAGDGGWHCEFYVVLVFALAAQIDLAVNGSGKTANAQGIQAAPSNAT